MGAEAQPIEELEPKPIVAAQHIFTRVTLAKSPRRLEGWQTYRYTSTGEHALNARDIRRIEGFLSHQRSFEPGDIRERWQFFPLDDQRVVFTRVVPRSETDRSGRTYLHMDHSLIVPVSEVRRLPEGVISFWNANLYANSLESLPPGVPWGSQAVDLIPRQIRINGLGQPQQKAVPGELGRLVEGKPAETVLQELEERGAQPLADLVRLIAEARKLTGNNLKIQIVGSEGPNGSIANVLHLAIKLAQAMSDTDETALSFTSWMEGELYNLPNFWAAGISKVPSRWHFHAVPVFAFGIIDSINRLNGNQSSSFTETEINQLKLSHRAVIGAFEEIKQREIEAATPKVVEQPSGTNPPVVPKNPPDRAEGLRGFMRDVIRRFQR